MAVPKHKGETASWAISATYRGQVERLLHLTPAKTPIRRGKNASWEAPLTSLKSECAKLKHTSLCYSQPLTPAHWLFDTQLNPALLQSSQGFNNLVYLLQAQHVQDHCRVKDAASRVRVWVTWSSFPPAPGTALDTSEHGQ